MDFDSYVVDTKELSQDQILMLLNSDKYLPPTTVDALEKRLRYLQKQHYHQIANEKSETATNFLVSAPPEITDKEYPMLNLPKSDGYKPTNNSQNNPLNYSRIIERKEAEEVKKSLVEGNHLVLYYDEIEKMYSDFAIFRVRMNYLLTNNKLVILGAIKGINPERGNHFCKLFKHDKLVIEERLMRNCLKIYNDASIIFNCFEKTINLWRGVKSQYHLPRGLSQGDIDCLKSILESLSYAESMEYLFEDKLSKYWERLSIFIEKISNQLLLIKHRKVASIGEIDNQIKIVEKDFVDFRLLIDEIVAEADPHLNCDYLITLGNYDDGKIGLVGISGYTYLDCNKKLDLSLKYDGIDDDVLFEITAEELEKHFNKKEAVKLVNSIEVFNYKNNRQRFFRVYFDIDENVEIPGQTAEIKIKNVPKGTRVLSCIISKPDSAVDDYPVLSSYYHRVNDWLDEETDYHMQKLTWPEYNKLNNNLKEYELEETSKNSFPIDFLFTELIKNDETQMIIREDMRESFRELAYHYSSKRK